MWMSNQSTIFGVTRTHQQLCRSNFVHVATVVVTTPFLVHPSTRATLEGRELCVEHVEMGRAETDAEPCLVRVIVNTMNKIYSERLVCIDYSWTTCTAHLSLLRIDFPTLIKKRAGEN